GEVPILGEEPILVDEPDGGDSGDGGDAGGGGETTPIDPPPGETTPVDPPEGGEAVPLDLGFEVAASPWTRCRADATTFTLAPGSGSDLSDDLLLQLNDGTRFVPVTLDVEAATFSAASFGGTLQLMAARRSRSTPTNEAPPALRASGIGLTRVGRSEQLHVRVFQRGDQLMSKLRSAPPNAPADEVILDADDLVRGWRLDVRPEGGAWRSLASRRGRVDITGAPGWELPDAEGWIAEALGGDDAGDLYVGEELIRWDGWSPVAPKPGTVIGTDDQLDERPTADALPALPVVVSYQPTPGTLVPLRYGRRYQLRVRAVDLAGNGPAGDPGSSAHASPRVLFGRLDPVRSPDLLLTAPRLPGEEVDRVVLRSHRWDQTPAESAEPIAARLVLPPRTTVTEAERHGVLDDAQGRPDPGRYPVLAARDAYALQEDDEGVEDPDDPTAGEEGTSRYFPLVDPGRERREVPRPLPVGFLPDPLARAVEIVRADGAPLFDETLGQPAPVLRLDGAGWPDAWRSLRIVVVESTSGVTIGWDEREGLLRVGLPKAETLRLRMSSRFDGDDLLRFGLADWLAAKIFEAQGLDWPASVEALQTTPLGRRIIAGRHWMVTPWRPLTLVHAVKQPLTDPKLVGEPAEQFVVTPRQLAETASQLSTWSVWHANSTGRLDLLAAWDEGVDLGPGTSAPEIRRIEVVAAELPRDTAGAPGTDGVVDAAHRPIHEHGDTKHRQISYRLEATTAFLDNFVETAQVTFAADGSAEIAAEVVPGTVALTGPGAEADDEPVTYQRDDGDGGDYRVIASDGATKVLRLGDAIPVETELTARFVTRPVSRRSEPVVVRSVLASARPAAPVIHSVLPTFGWTESRSGRSATSTRQGAGVRVWLERPWWTSGLGEELAVLYLTGSAQPAPSAAPFVTQWGRDPIHAGGSVQGALNDAAFPRRFAGSVGLRPPGGPVVRAVPHRVVYDATRDMWRCDIDLQLGSYWPFVRLALARFQPAAIVASDPPGSPADTTLGLSPVVLADIVQLAPNRVATVSGARFGAFRRLSISVTGASFTTTTVDSAAPIVEATVQRQPLSATSDVDWETVAGPITLARQAAPLPLGDQFVKQHRWSGLALVSRQGITT
ncbi:MAG TPA: hypothetical protein VK866_11460, partial [Acidimicrobiales bacterium]|nr:hypothetical protein [Acidimicrobiales bacterium]